jgi:hypothetical protein
MRNLKQDDFAVPSTKADKRSFRPKRTPTDSLLPSPVLYFCKERIAEDGTIVGDPHRGSRAGNCNAVAPFTWSSLRMRASTEEQNAQADGHGAAGEYHRYCFGPDHYGADSAFTRQPNRNDAADGIGFSSNWSAG